MSICIRSWSRGTEFIDENQRHRTITGMIEKQMAAVYPVLISPANLTNGQFTTSVGYLFFNGSESNVQFVGLNSMSFLKHPGLTLISYDLERQPQGTLSLVEKEAPYVGQDPEDAGSAIESSSMTVFENLESGSFEFYDPGDGSAFAKPGWVTEWDGKTLGRLPKAIAVAMTFKEANKKNLSRRMIVPIMAAPRTTAQPYPGLAGGS
jgi:hypothetical protein